MKKDKTNVPVPIDNITNQLYKKFTKSQKEVKILPKKRQRIDYEPIPQNKKIHLPPKENKEKANPVNNSQQPNNQLPQPGVSNTNTKNSNPIASDSEVEVDLTQEEMKSQDAAQPKDNIRLPPIMVTIQNISNVNMITQLAATTCKDKVTFKFVSNQTLNIHTHCKLDFINLKTKLDTEDYKFFTYSIKNKKPRHLVLRGLPELPIQDLEAEIKTQITSITRVIRMKQKPTSTGNPLYLVTVPNPNQLNVLRQIKYLKFFKEHHFPGLAPVQHRWNQGSSPAITNSTNQQATPIHSNLSTTSRQPESQISPSTHASAYNNQVCPSVNPLNDIPKVQELFDEI
ncbi:hypothetical protein KQX54_011791, partial [Cotesia glomerata]